jgi:hypothetical protein
MSGAEFHNRVMAGYAEIDAQREQAEAERIAAAREVQHQDDEPEIGG